jgi:hypothetical protein
LKGKSQKSLKVGTYKMVNNNMTLCGICNEPTTDGEVHVCTKKALRTRVLDLRLAIAEHYEGMQQYDEYLADKFDEGEPCEVDDSQLNIKLWQTIGLKFETPTENCWWEDQGDFYDANCGGRLLMNMGTIDENGIKFCPNCGKPVKEFKKQ